MGDGELRGCGLNERRLRYLHQQLLADEPREQTARPLAPSEADRVAPLRDSFRLA